MKHAGFFLAVWLAFAPPVLAGDLSESEASHLREDITEMMTAFAHGDWALLVERTHPSLPALMGGRDAYEQITRQAMQQLDEAGVRFAHFELGVPTATHAAGDEEVCFVPTYSVIDVQGKQAKSTSFMIAIRKAKGGSWTYLDGSGLRDNPDLLHRLLPELERGLPMPPNHIEPVAGPPEPAPDITL